MSSTILCVADDRHLCKILEKSLTSEGYQVYSARDGEEALRSFEDHAPRLVILDIILPKKDGFAVLQALRASPGTAAQTPVLLLSSCRITTQYEERARALKAQALLAKPVSLERLLTIVQKHVKTPPPSSGKDATAHVPLVGSFKEISFPHLLHQLHGLRATGVLRLVSGKKRKLLQLRNGYPESIKSNLVNECLGSALIRRGLGDEATIEESVRRMKRGEGLQGQILIAMEVLGETELSDALRDQALDKLFEVFEWKDARFKFEKDAQIQRANSLSVGQSPANLIVEGIRRFAREERITSFFAANADRHLAAGKSDFYRFQDIDFLPAEEELISKIDGSRKLADYARLDDRAKRTLYALLITEFLELGGSGEKATAQKRVKPTLEAPGRPGPERQVDRGHREELAKIASRIRGQNFFEMLGVEPDSAPRAIEGAFEQAARRVHPDRFVGASEAVQQLAEQLYDRLTEAHETLSNPKTRTLYILELKKGERQAAKEAAGRRSLEAEVQFQKGEALLKARDYERALACFGGALEAYPDEGEYHAHYGWCLHLCHPDDTSIVQEAIEHVRRGIKLAGNREKPYLFLGRLYKAIGRSAAAEKMFTRALQILPDCVEAMRELRLINLRREKKGLIGKLLRR